jgi:dUTP pyrophosphatase
MENSLKLYYVGNPIVKATNQSAGFDLVLVQPARLRPREINAFSTGTRIALPANTVGLIVPRSSTPLRWGVTLANSPGILDADYRGDIKLILWNLTDREVEIPPNVKLAQLVVIPIPVLEALPFQGTLEEFETSTERGANGFGSSGT